MSKHTHPLLIGAHTSAAGGVHNALLEGQSIGATTIQLFTANQKRWESKPLEQSEIAKWEESLEATGISQVMSHDSYLINLGAPDEMNLRKSRIAFEAEIKRCLELKLAFLNFHPGAALKESKELCLDRIVESLLAHEKLLENSPTRLLIEATAGQGSCVGWKFEELAYIIERTEKKLPIGICIDTCHIFVAGYDIRTAETWDKTLNEFDKIVGLRHLYAFHVNDSMKTLGSRVDRHADLGTGEIGWESFRVLMNDPRTRNIPKYLETPSGPAVWAQEIAKLRTI